LPERKNNNGSESYDRQMPIEKIFGDYFTPTVDKPLYKNLSFDKKRTDF
jgi:hypothetical protein